MSEPKPGRHPQVTHVEDAEARTMSQGSRFGATIRPLGRATGATWLGCNHFEVEPGRTAFPHHYHCAIEEAVFILEGEGTLRLGDETMRVRAGDYVSFPAGPDHAHQITNSGPTPLKYLCVSTRSRTDVVGYPDSKKVAAMAGPSFDFLDPPWLRAIYKQGTEVGYYDGEDVGE
jgi:uncharacterized cupin superfamily protein